MKALLIATAVGNVTGGFVLSIVFLASVGASRSMDTFLAVHAVMLVLFSVLVGSAINVILPLMSERNADRNRGRVAAGLCGWTVLLSSGVAAVSWLSAPIWIPLVLPGYADADLRLALSLARIASVGFVASALASCLMAACHARLKNLAAESLQALATLIALSLAILIVPRHGIVAAAWVLVGRSLLAALLLLPLARLSPAALWDGEHIRETRRRLLPLILGTVCYKASPLVDANLASRGPTGEYTVLNLISQIFAALATVVQQSMVNSTISRLSLLKAQERGDEMILWTKRMLGLALGFGVAICAIGLALIQPVLYWANPLLPSAAGIDPALAQLLLLCASGLFIAGFAGQIAAATFYAKGDTRVPALVGAVGFVTASAAKVAGFFAFGVPGVALGMSLNQLQNTILLAYRALSVR